MGEKNELPIVVYSLVDGKWTTISQNMTAITLADDECDTERQMWSGVFTAELKFRVPRSRKRFKKFLMANGYSRDKAEGICQAVVERGWSYSYAFAQILFSL